MKVENMTYNAKTAFTERREIIDKLNECINSINTYGPEKIKDLESKNVQQDSDIASLKSTSNSQMLTITAHETRINNIENKNVQQDSDIANIKTKNVQQDDDINNLKNADTNNVKINRINEYAVGLTGNQDISGIKKFISGISAYPADWHNAFITGTGSNIGDINLFAKLKNQNLGKYLIFELMESSNTAICYGILGVHNSPTNDIGWFLRKGFGINNPLQKDSIVIVSDGTNIYLGSRKKTTYGNLMIRVKIANTYGNIDTNPTGQIEWLSAPINIGDGSGYVLTEAME